MDINLLRTRYYQGDALAHLEVVIAYAGIFGKGAYSGYRGELLVDKNIISYNAFGVNGRPLFHGRPHLHKVAILESILHNHDTFTFPLLEGAITTTVVMSRVSI